jgi:addiction module HigA family antidote
MTPKSSTITELKTSPLPPLHPGEVLREEFMAPLGLTAYRVAKACRIPRTRIERVVREEVGITADTALRLGRLFGTSAEFWLTLQARHDIEASRLRIAAELDQIEPAAERAAA